MTDPQRLVDELIAAGWTVAGRGRGHTRLAWPDERPGSLVILLDPSAPEYKQHMAGVFAELEAAVNVGVKAAHVLAGQVASANRQARETPR